LIQYTFDNQFVELDTAFKSVYLGSQGQARAFLSEDGICGAGTAVGGHERPAALGPVGERGVVQALHGG